MSKTCDVESGEQLWARLGARSSLKGLEPALLGTKPLAGEIIEIYGGDGTGKTELLLHLVVAAILPPIWFGFSLGGCQTQVVWVDMDLKFSVFRLALILKQRIQKAVWCEKDDGVVNLESESKQRVEVDNDENKNVDPVKLGVCKTEGEISREDIEKLVQQCLERVQVVHCASTQQLLCTLHGMESNIAANPQISLLVLDPISAFFWSDKVRDFEHSSSYLHKNISYIVSILSKFSQKYDLTMVITKQALISCKKKDSRSDEVIHSLNSGFNRKVKDIDTHVEFLGKTWNDMISKRFVCVRVHGQAAVKFMLKDLKEEKQFVIQDDGVKFF